MKWNCEWERLAIPFLFHGIWSNHGDVDYVHVYPSPSLLPPVDGKEDTESLRNE